MIGAWGFAVPFGLTIAIMCKAVFPGKKFVIVRDECVGYSSDWHLHFMIGSLGSDADWYLAMCAWSYIDSCACQL